MALFNCVQTSFFLKVLNSLKNTLILTISLLKNTLCFILSSFETVGENLFILNLSVLS